MRLLLVVLLAFLSFPVQAGEVDWASKIYQVSDVSVDMTDTNASLARDKAIIQAQRDAFTLLLARLNAASFDATRLTDDDIALLVQAFEIQKEKTSAIRYVGTFTIQFKPQAVQTILNKGGASYSDKVGDPVLVLPIVMRNNAPILWEESTPWKDAWSVEAAKGSRSPLIVPPGDLDDIAIIDGKEALSAEGEGLARILDKYKSTHLVLALLTEKVENTKTVFEVSILKYEDGQMTPAQTTKIGPFADTASTANGMASTIKQIHDTIDMSSKAAAVTGSLAFLPVLVPTQTMATWTSIKSRLDKVARVSKVDVISMGKGHTQAQVAFYGNIPDLQNALREKGLILYQELTNGPWLIIKEE